jgi:hypothetical protein
MSQNTSIIINGNYSAANEMAKIRCMSMFVDNLGVRIALTPVKSADNTGPFQERPCPFLNSESSQETSQVASMSGTTCLRTRHVSIMFNAPENLQLSIIECIFGPVERRMLVMIPISM